ncbi:MAG: SH3 domain-containing protein [Candidatus Shapirobacteria bacterium]
MDLSKLQIIALVVLTTILTDKFLINHNLPVATLPIIEKTISNTPIPTMVNVGTTISSNTSQNELILKEIQNLRKDIVAVREASTTVSPSLIGGMVKISSPQWKRVDVFEKPLASSKIVNSIVYDTIYFYSTKSDGWYQLSLDNGASGYVQSTFLKEFP